MVDSCAYKRRDIDRVLSGAILHDVCRYDLDGSSQYSHKDHPRLVRKLMDKHRIGVDSSFREEVLEDIEKHMGRWDKSSYIPKISTSGILHLADVIDAKLEEIK